MKRILALMMALCGLFGLLSGCGQEETQPEPAAVSGDLTVLFPKVGSADAALLMTDSATVIIDTGESNDGDELLELLSAYGRTSVDLLCISHYDKDHVGGAAELLENVPVSRVIGSTSPKESDEMTAYLAALEQAGLTEETPSETVTVTFGGLAVTVDPPRRSTYHADQSNNSSTIITVTYGETKLLFAGDAMTARLAEFSWQEGQYDLIKIPHHGRDAADVSYYLSSFKDGAYAVVTSSKKEPESDELMAALAEAGVRAHRTRDGDVTVVSDGTSLTVTQSE